MLIALLENVKQAPELMRAMSSRQDVHVLPESKDPGGIVGMLITDPHIVLRGTDLCHVDHLLGYPLNDLGWSTRLLHCLKPPNRRRYKHFKCILIAFSIRKGTEIIEE